MDLSENTYDDVILFLQKNLLCQVKRKPCVKNNYKEIINDDKYELIIVSNDEYFEPPFEKKIKYGDCYYYILYYNDEQFYNELSVIDCGGYYIAMCIFKNKINITNEIIYNKKYSNDDDYFMKFHMKTYVDKKEKLICKIL